MVTFAEVLALFPDTIRDDRAEYFMEILWWLTVAPENLDSSIIPPSAIPYKLGQFGLAEIAGRATRLPLANQRELLAEATQIRQLSGTPWSIKRVLELFQYTGAILNENPTIASTKYWGYFEVRLAQSFNYSEVEAIVNLLKPPSRKVFAIRSINAILLDGSRLLNGSTQLEGYAGIDDDPIPWTDPATALTPIAELTAIPDLLTTSTNDAVNSFNPQLQAILNRIKWVDDRIVSLAPRIASLYSQLANISGGDISSQLAAINAGIATLANSNQALLTRINDLTPQVSSLTNKTNDLETQTTTIVQASAARQLDLTVQRKDPDLEAIAALATSSPFPAGKVISTNSSNQIQLTDAPAIAGFIPQFANLEFKQPSGTNAGNYPTAGAWTPMPFSLTVNDDSFVSSISASRYSLPSGFYIIIYNWQCCGGLRFGGRIWNQTSGSVLENGSPGRTATSGGAAGDTWAAEGTLITCPQFTVTTQLEFQFRAEALHSAGAALTAGQATSNAVEQLYQQVVIWKWSN
jgi:Phage tail protein (Tail_P2_I)